jgi:hypothetical protein
MLDYDITLPSKSIVLFNFVRQFEKLTLSVHYTAVIDMSSSLLPCKFEYLITIQTFIPLQNQPIGIVSLVAHT